jgi:hypothetical protein
VIKRLSKPRAMIDLFTMNSHAFTASYDSRFFMQINY